MLHRFPYPRFSLRALLVVVTVLCLALGWFFNRLSVQRRVVAEVNALGGFASYAHMTPVFNSIEPLDPNISTRNEMLVFRDHKPPGPAWLRRMLGEDALAQLDNITLRNPHAPAELVGRIASIPTIRALKLDTKKHVISPDVVRQLAQLDRLETLTLNVAGLSPSELEPLKGLARLHSLDLGGVSQEQLPAICALKQLTFLKLYSSQPLVGGMADLQAMSQLQALQLEGPGVTDATIAALEPPRSLRRLHLTDTRVTDASVDRIAHMRGLTYVGFDSSVSAQTLRQYAGYPAIAPAIGWLEYVDALGETQMDESDEAVASDP